MKFLHLSDLHLGKRVNEFSMIEEQKYILEKILGIIDIEQPNGVLVAGDVYDKSIPTVEAVNLFDDFLVSLSKRKINTFVISGNHDSPDRIAYGSRIFDSQGIYLSPVYNGAVEPIKLTDKYGDVYIYMLPFVKPVHVRNCFEDEKIENYTDALRVAVEHMSVDSTQRNIVLAHQFVVSSGAEPERSDSEDISVGGLDSVDASVFDCFDYTALGHIHGPQRVGKETVRYCGTPLKYSFSEENHRKSVTVVELAEKGNIMLKTIPLKPLHDMKTIRGSFEELTSRDFYGNINTEDYIRVMLTDEDSIPDAIGKLRLVYPRVMCLDYDNTRTRSVSLTSHTAYAERKSEAELFAEFFKAMTGREMTDEQTKLICSLTESLKEVE